MDEDLDEPAAGCWTIAGTWILPSITLYVFNLDRAPT